MSTQLNDYFRHRVRTRMTQLGITQSQLAQQMGVTRQYISHLMTGHRNPGLDTLEKTANALDVPATWLISEDLDV